MKPENKLRLCRIVLGMLLAVLVPMWLFLGLPIYGLSTCQSTSVSKEFCPRSLNPEESFIFLDSDGNQYLHSYNNNLWQYHFGIPFPIGKAKISVPIDNGVAFIHDTDDSREAFLYQNYRTIKLTDNCTSLCWDGTQLLLFDAQSGSVYSYHERMLTSIFQIEPIHPEAYYVLFLASERWVIIGHGKSGVHVFDRDLQKHITYDIEIGRDVNEAFLCNDALFIVGNDCRKETLIVLNLITSEKYELNIGLDTCESFVNASAVYSEYTSILYISMRSDWPLYLGIEDQSMTIALNIDTTSYEILNNEFYSGLFIKEGKLYGTRPITGRIVRLL